jgi:hypothetical protein
MLHTARSNPETFFATCARLLPKDRNGGFASPLDSRIGWQNDTVGADTEAIRSLFSDPSRAILLLGPWKSVAGARGCRCSPQDFIRVKSGPPFGVASFFLPCFAHSQLVK